MSLYDQVAMKLALWNNGRLSSAARGPTCSGLKKSGRDQARKFITGREPFMPPGFASERRGCAVTRMAMFRSQTESDDWGVATVFVHGFVKGFRRARRGNGQISGLHSFTFTDLF
jgi:hypothetical protein